MDILSELEATATNIRLRVTKELREEGGANEKELAGIRWTGAVQVLNDIAYLEFIVPGAWDGRLWFSPTDETGAYEPQDMADMKSRSL